METALEPGVTLETSQEDDFVALFESEYGRLVRALYVLSGSGSEAEDLAQEALARVYERWQRVRGMESPIGYLYRVALNLHRRGLRAPRHLGLREVQELEGGLSDVDQRSDLAKAVSELSPRLREALFLHEWLGFTSEQVAKLIHVRPSSVRARLSRARKELREKLGDDYA